jgi:hypothetical protein
MFKSYEYFKEKYGNRPGNWQVCIEGQIMILPLAIEMYLVQKHWHKRDKGIKKIYRKELMKFLKQIGM